MSNMQTLLRHAAIAVAALVITFAASSAAADILDDWDSRESATEARPQAVTVESSTTALLIMDMMKVNCGIRPRCVATVPNVKRLHDAARDSGNHGVVQPGWQQQSGHAGGHDRLQDFSRGRRMGAPRRSRQISWLAFGRKAEGAQHQDGHRVRHFVSGCRHRRRLRRGAARLQSDRPRRLPLVRRCSNEQYAAWHVFKGGPAGVTSQVTLTRSTMVKF